MEILAPAGDIEKLEIAYLYGADAAYIGIPGFSLRSRADDNGPEGDAAALTRIKANRRLYGALNIYLHNADLRALEARIEAIVALPLDAVIVSDIGAIALLRRYLPNVELHLSTQANCLNTEAARMYRDMGFSRIIPAREMSLDDLAEMKAALPDLEIEVFVHGAMCLAYSGRCLLSAWQAGRSGNKGDCAHSCRWNYRYAVEESERPGLYYPVEEGDGFTTILSPKDLCMIDHLQALSDAGVDALKIEGRMKSVYYTAVVTRAYRKELDRIAAGAPVEASAPYTGELFNVSHRAFSTGFYFGDPESLVTTRESYHRSYRYLARVVRSREIAGTTRYELHVKNGFGGGERIEYLGPDLACAEDTGYMLFSTDGRKVDRLTHQAGGWIEPQVPLARGHIIRGSA